MIDANLWNQILIWPITNLLVFFYRIAETLHIPGPLGWAVILLTIAIRLILYPLMHSQMKSAKKMQDLKPKLDELAKKHQGDKATLQKAQMDLYKDHGVNPAAGCLPLLVQMPVLIALYNVFNQVLNNGNLEKVIGEINQIVYLPFLKLTSLDLSFLGSNLAVKPSEWQTKGWWLLVVPLATGLLQYWQTKLMMGQQAAKADNQLQIAEGKNQTKKGKPADAKTMAVIKEEKNEPDQAAEMQKQMAIISPIMFAVFAFQFPLGLALYWNVFGIFGIIQQMKVNKS